MLFFWIPTSIFQVPVSILQLPVLKLQKFSLNVSPRLDFKAFWASNWQPFSVILGIIFVAVFNEFGNVNFQLVVIQPKKYTYLYRFSKNILLCAFMDFWWLELRNADSETAGGAALLSINILEQRPPGASRASRPGTQDYGNRASFGDLGHHFSKGVLSLAAPYGTTLKH